MQTEFYLLRHGQCEHEGIMRGQVDAQLTALGREQMQQSFAQLNIVPDHIWHSPLSRCAGFAQDLAAELALDAVSHDGLMEMNFGDWDGHKIDDLYRDYPQMLDTFWRNPWRQTPPNGEAMLDFEARIDSVWQNMLANCQGKILVVTHAGVMRHLLASILARGEHQFFSQLDLPYAKAIKVTVYAYEGDNSVRDNCTRESFARVHL